MKISHNLALPLAVALLGLVLVPGASAVGVANCPVEPKQGVPIASGDVFAGGNCTLKQTTDVDSFVFTANSGDIWHFLVSGNNEGDFGIDICLTLLSPSASQIFSGCANTAASSDFAVVTDQKLSAAGTYTILVTELTNGTLNYGLSLERLYPTPPDGQKIALSQMVTGTLSPGEDAPAPTFAGATTGKYEASATIPNGVPFQDNLCMTVYSSLGTSAGTACTDTNARAFTIKIDFTPAQDGTYMALLNEAGSAGSGTVNYSLEVSCLVGKCTQFLPPPCTLKDTASYSAGTLTMNFTVGNNVATTWNAWLTYQSTISLLFSTAQPITVPPVPITQTTSLSPKGKVGVLSTLTTPKGGIICSSWEQVATGMP